MATYAVKRVDLPALSYFELRSETPMSSTIVDTFLRREDADAERRRLENGGGWR